MNIVIILVYKITKFQTSVEELICDIIPYTQSALAIKSLLKYDKQDRQGKAAFNERSPHPTQQQAPAAKSPGGPQRKTGQGTSSLN
jgi:hypothetical protein